MTRPGRHGSAVSINNDKEEGNRMYIGFGTVVLIVIVVAVVMFLRRR